MELPIQGSRSSYCLQEEQGPYRVLLHLIWALSKEHYSILGNKDEDRLGDI